MANTPKITYGLWFDGNAAEAIAFYQTVFNNVSVREQANYSDIGMEQHRQQPGTLMFANFTLEDATFQAINGGSEFRKNPSVSYFINCAGEDEAQRYWDALSEGGKTLMALDSYDWSPRYGWLEDKFGVSWQVYTVQPGREVSQKINPSLMFVNKAHGRAEEAVHFYTSVFEDSATEGILKYPAGGMDPEGTVMHAQFVLNGGIFMAMDSAQEHHFDFNGGNSLIVNCTTQEEIDRHWNRLLEGGKEWECGWLEDKFGVAWQIVPRQLDKMMSSDDEAARKRVTAEMMSQVKLDLARLEAAFEGQKTE
jgi:predicted 3-demethylubiquinone-9 3-methyltransferase (glyoxalase superfamily)